MSVESAQSTVTAAVTLRAARPGDESAIVDMVRGLAAHAGDAALAKVTPEGLHDALHGAQSCLSALVAETSGAIVGICLYSRIFSTWRGVPGFYVIDLYVAPEARGGRIGEQLLARLAADGRAKGYGFLRLDVDHQNIGAHRFYKRLGFGHVERDQSYAIGGDAFTALAASDGRP